LIQADLSGEACSGFLRFNCYDRASIPMQGTKMAHINENSFPKNPENQRNMAGLRNRLFASMIDGILLSVAYTIFKFIFEKFIGVTDYKNVFYLFLFCCTLSYHAISESSNRKGSFGKQLIGIEVVTEFNTKIDFITALTRNFLAFALGFSTLGYNHLKIGFGSHRAFHDQLTGCYVVNKTKNY
jgi:uncharacterized RDD family membrane protein YckC